MQRYMPAIALRIVRCIFLIVLCNQGPCETAEQASRHPSLTNSLQTLTGTFDVDVKSPHCKRSSLPTASPDGFWTLG